MKIVLTTSLALILASTSFASDDYSPIRHRALDSNVGVSIGGLDINESTRNGQVTVGLDDYNTFYGR